MATATAARRGVTFSEGNHRYSIDGRHATAVSTALKGIPKDALVRWAAKTVAEYVTDNIHDVKRMLDTSGPGFATHFLTELPNQKRDTAAVRGTAVHGFAERVIRGEEVEVPDHLVPYVEGYLHFLEDFDPVTVHEELIVASREHMIAGRLDSIQQIPGFGLCQVDYKTSSGVYGEHALQVAAYRHMEVCVVDGEEQPNPQVEHTFVLHIMPGEYALIPVQAGPVEFGYFLTALANYRQNVMSNRLSKLIGEPVEPPRREIP